MVSIARRIEIANYRIETRIKMRKLILIVLLASGSAVQSGAQAASWMPDLTQQQTYTLHHASSSEAMGASIDWRTVNPGETLTILDVDGPGPLTKVQPGGAATQIEHWVLYRVGVPPLTDDAMDNVILPLVQSTGSSQ